MMNAEDQQHRTKRIKTDNGIEESIRKLMAVNETFISLERKLPASSTVDCLRESLKEAADRLLSEYEKEMKKVTGVAAMFLSKLDDRKHDKATVKAVINAFPEALRHYNDSGFSRWPACDLMANMHGYSFVPLLASEGKRLKMFTEEERGGLNDPDIEVEYYEVLDFLLLEDGRFDLRTSPGVIGNEFMYRKSDENDVEFQARLIEAHEANDEKRTKVLQQLFELNIIPKEDIIVQCMIQSSSKCVTSKRRLEYLLNLCPESLATRVSSNLPLEYHVLFCYKEGFGILLKAGIKYYPRNLGFLFEKHPVTGKRTIEYALSRENGNWELTYNDIFEWIHDAIPPTDKHPILHDIIRLAPKYFSLFWKYYPDAIYLRDQKGRLPLHIALQRASKWSSPLLSLVGINDPIDRHEKDPVSGLYPFMSAASCGSNDLNVVYYLLRRDPSVWKGFRVLP